MRRLLDTGQVGARWRQLVHFASRQPVVEWFWTNRSLLVYRMPTQTLTLRASDPEICRNKLSDLEVFEQTQSWLPRDKFLAEARQRLSDGLDVYSVVRGNVLLHYCWVVPHQARGWFPYVRQHYEYPARTCVYFNAYTHPAARGQGLYARSLRQAVKDAVDIHNAEFVYLAVESPNMASRSVVERTGFACVDVLYDHRRLGRQHRGRLTPKE